MSLQDRPRVPENTLRSRAIKQGLVLSKSYGGFFVQDQTSGTILSGDTPLSLDDAQAWLAARAQIATAGAHQPIDLA